ncbi:Hypothetical protein P9303_26231 [Prochlorococcus marinus str. MIT 9303]|uniref:Uncharacterized protein n=1 Tax=Prochlorococcus marinus (strain MIT 9303) TaxID=59922 RepID=A2CCZ3_PROM3|nr:Hypothetical protein P9303_26231 [Prochlorococcus marinus str. MIT 9303]
MIGRRCCDGFEVFDQLTGFSSGLIPGHSCFEEVLVGGRHRMQQNCLGLFRFPRSGGH